MDEERPDSKWESCYKKFDARYSDRKQEIRIQGQAIMYLYLYVPDKHHNDRTSSPTRHPNDLGTEDHLGNSDDQGPRIEKYRFRLRNRT
jgi:hypothetical protein